MTLPTKKITALAAATAAIDGTEIFEGVKSGITKKYTQLQLRSYPITPAEQAAGVTPVNYFYLPEDPRRLGVIGDGVTDDTAAMNKVVAVTNAGQNFKFKTMTILCSPLNTLTANDLSWHFDNSSIKVKANSWSSSSHLNISGLRPSIFGLTMDGNQSAFTSAPQGQLLNLTTTCTYPTLERVTLKNSPCRAFQEDSVVGGQFVDCHFDDNANLGAHILACSRQQFTNCTCDRNGYGYQQSFATNTFSAFGFALRYRSHHITFVNCTANECGREGMNTNQGSYAIKYIGSTCWRNGDGGFTIASDNTSTGRPGESEACYDLEYIDCEGANNWGSGLVAYQACHNVTVQGGRYYNNGRSVGVLAMASSLPNGIYFPSGCTGINVDVKAYDDRQLRPITANASGVLTATGWVSGTMDYYPRVALYNASMAFQGYGTITAESAGSVTVATTANNGVTVASIASGWFISQRVQHQGVFLDNNVQAIAAVDGFGFLPGISSIYGNKILSGNFAGGQNVVLPKEPLSLVELLSNPSWDASTGTGVSWTYSLTGGGVATYYTTADSNRRSPGALKLVAGTSDALGDAVLITDGLKYCVGSFVEFSCWVNATNAGDAYIALIINNGSSLQTTVTHPGGGYKLLRIGAYVAAAATAVTARVAALAAKTAYFDEATLRVRSVSFDYRDYYYPSRYLPY